MTTLTWILIAIVYLIVQLIFIYIVIHKAYRFKHTIDPIDARVKEMKGNKLKNNHRGFTK